MIKNILVMMLMLLAAATVEAQGWQMQPVPIPTRWAALVSPSKAWPEYPRPQMVRPNWENLNGLWEYAVTSKEASAPDRYTGRILVPYPLESALSGVKQALQPDQLLWYRRTISIANRRAHERVLLHFGAVDYEATVYLNDRNVGTHRGGYQSFTIEITDALRNGDNHLVVKVYDPTEQGANPHGKQNRQPEWMYYSSSSGIWQTVWVERVPATYIEGIKLTPDVDRSELRIQLELNGRTEGASVEAVARSGQKIVARQILVGSGVLKIPEPRLWSPDYPYLYDLQIRLLREGKVVDEISSYFGLRKVKLRKDADGIARIFLNDKYTYNLGVVDQGYWPDGIYTAPTDAALKFDVQTAKALGFNTVRKHIKVEPQRWYYHCDQLGLLVWQDMPSSNNDSVEGRQQFETEIKENLRQLHNHPSITTWVLFNEGWGAYDQERLAAWMKRADPSRLLDGHSGPYDQIKAAQWMKRLPPSQMLYPLGGADASADEGQSLQLEAPEGWRSGDLMDLHFYPGPRMFPAQAKGASVTGEYGSFGAYIEGHVWDELQPVGRGAIASGLSPSQLLEAYAHSIDQLATLEKQGLSGSSYFEIVDVEGEHQGFLTYDRAVAKVPVEQIERANAKLVPRARNYAQATAGFSVDKADWEPEPRRYASRVTEFLNGRRDLSFLMHLAVMAIRQGDAPRAREIGDAFIAQLARPFTRDTWKAVLAVTYSSDSQGFELLRNRANEVNARLGAQTAQEKMLEIIQREAIVPYFKDVPRKLSWSEFENSVAAKHGSLGTEAVYGAEMMEHLSREDWTNFGKLYVQYFESATARSLYPRHSLSYRVLKHVNEPRAVETAVRVMRWQLDAPRESPVFGRYDPTELDTYANLLFKAGRTSEAIEWQHQAVALSEGRDREISENFERMKAARACSVGNCTSP